MREFLTRPLFDLGGNPVNGLILISALLVVLASLALARLVGRAMSRWLGDHLDRLQRSNLQVTVRLVQYLIVSLGVAVALHIVGIRLTALFAAGALLAVAVGFAMQNVTSNFVAGLILLLERSIKPGDIIEVDGQVIQVREMAIRATIARTLDEEDLIIPSSILVQSVVKNYTLRDALTRLRVPVGVVYSSDMAAVRSTLEGVARDLEWRSTQRDPVVLMRQFGSSSVDFEVSVWFDEPWRRLQRSSDVHEAVWWALKDAGITIAFPQLDVHLDPGDADLIRQEAR